MTQKNDTFTTHDQTDQLKLLYKVNFFLTFSSNQLILIISYSHLILTTVTSQVTFHFSSIYVNFLQFLPAMLILTIF